MGYWNVFYLKSEDLVIVYFSPFLGRASFWRGFGVVYNAWQLTCLVSPWIGLRESCRHQEQRYELRPRCSKRFDCVWHSESTVVTVCYNWRQFVRGINELMPVWLRVLVSESAAHCCCEDCVRKTIQGTPVSEELWHGQVLNWSLVQGLCNDSLRAVELCILNQFWSCFLVWGNEQQPRGVVEPSSQCAITEVVVLKTSVSMWWSRGLQPESEASLM